MRGNVYIGTSGWQYKHWIGNFYPHNIPQRNWLSYYSKYFDSLEINSSFYRLPKFRIFEKWRKQVPSNFTFAIKGNRYITHIKRLKNCQESLGIFIENLNPLKSKNRHVILWQLPPNLKIDIERLNNFIKILPVNFRHAFEFRNNSWIDKKVLKIFRNKDRVEKSIVLQDWREWPIFWELNQDFVYIRFHGNRELYASNYSKQELAQWANKVQKWIKAGTDVYVYFNNDAFGYAVRNATTLKELI